MRPGETVRRYGEKEREAEVVRGGRGVYSLSRPEEGERTGLMLVFVFRRQLTMYPFRDRAARGV